MKGIRLSILIVGGLLVAMNLCAAQNVGQQLVLNLDTQKKFQRIDNFAASDAWSGNFVGKYFGEAEKDQIARWLFSKKFDKDGNPEGIGISLWRVNLGGGTLEQKDCDIKPFRRRAESYLSADMTSYDWTKCAGHQYFMSKAREYGCEGILFFSNTPLVNLTKNGKGYGSEDRANLREDAYGLFADYLADVAEHFSKQGYNIRYISPVNEPNGGWKGNKAQEGSIWRNSEIAKMARALDASLSSRRLDGVKIYISEAHDLRDLYDVYDVTSPDRLLNLYLDGDAPDRQIRAFFDKSSPDYIGDLKHLPRMISGHSYYCHNSNTWLRDVRVNLRRELDRYNVEFQQSEWCLLPLFRLPMDGFTNDYKQGDSNGIQPVLLMGRIIVADLNIARATAWGYWKGIEINGAHALTGVLPKNGGEDFTGGGKVFATKLLWGFGNFCRFIRPDYTRVELSGADDLFNVAGTAFVSPDGRRAVAVFVHSGFETAKVSLKLGQPFGCANFYRTSKDENLKFLGSSSLSGTTAEFELMPRSITTVVFE